MDLSNLFKSNTAFYTCAVILSIVFSLMSVLHAGVINPDGILYLRVAQTWLEQGIKSALQHYSLPFYAIFIASISQLFSLSLETAAYTLNFLFQALMVIYFIRIINVLGGNTRIKWFALFVILLFPHLIDYRSFIVRDFGYWAGHLAGLFYLLRYCRSFSYRDCCLSLLALGLACLFRVEGLLFFVLTPFAFFVIPQLNRKQRTQAFMRFSSTILIFSSASFLLLWLIINNPKQLIEQWPFFFQGFSLWQHSIQTNIHKFADLVLNEQSRRSATPIVVSGLVGYFIIKLIKVINPIYVLLTAFALIRGLMPAARSQVGILLYFFMINVMITVYFVGIFFFLSGRYLLTMAMIALLWVPFTLDYLYLRIFANHQRKKNWVRKFSFLGLMVLMSFLGLHNYIQFSHSKHYLHHAGQWLTEHASANQNILTNSAPILFYAKGSRANWTQEYQKDLTVLLSSKLESFDYVALRFNKNNHQQLPIIAMHFFEKKPVAVFSNGNKEKVLIYSP